MAKAAWSTLGKKKKLSYLESMRQLYGEQTDWVEGAKTPTLDKKPRLKVVNNSPSEDQEQFAFVHWLKLKKIRHHHSPNGGARTLQAGAKFKRLGTSPGYPDIQIPLPSRGYMGLYIELKRKKGGVVSPEQKEWLEWLNANGSKAVVCRGAEEAICIVEEYFGL